MRRVEIWSNGQRWRTITVHETVHPGAASNPKTYDIQYSWGKFDHDFSHYIRMLGGVRRAYEGTTGAGVEKWYHHLYSDQAALRLEAIRDAAIKAGFVQEDKWETR